MKTIFFRFKKFLTISIASLMLIFSLVSCSNSIKGEGKIGEKDSILKPISKLEIQGSFNVFYQVDSVYSVKIEANENLISNIKIENTDGELKLSELKSVSSFEIYKIIISGKNIEEISLNDNIQFEVNGQINQEKLKLSMHDNSKFIGNIAVSELNLEQKDNTNSNLSGSSANAELKLSDNAITMSPLLNVSEATVYLDDNAQAKVMALKILEGTGTGNSKLHYQGEPNKNYTTKEQAICEKK